MAGDNITSDDLEKAHAKRLLEIMLPGAAAKVMGIDPATLYRKRLKWGITVNKHARNPRP